MDTVPDPILQEPDDIVLKITATAICGSDLHLYRGKMPELKNGDIPGHEFMGTVVDTGSEVTGLQKDDRVVSPSLSPANNASSARVTECPFLKQLPHIKSSKKRKTTAARLS